MSATMQQSKRPASFFDAIGFEHGVDIAVQEVADVYLSDDIPWVVGYSGGKDSTATVQLIWSALQRIGADRAKKPVHIISTDTLVENPVVAAWVANSLGKMEKAAREQGFPVTAHRLTPDLADSFWVNLIGRGYPAPRQKFRWCTDRLKIRPAHNFIASMVNEHGEALLVLGTRKAESAARAKTMARHEKGRWRDKISPNGNLPNSFIFTPIENWSNDDVWLFLLDSDTSNPWGHDNMELFSMYKGATEDGECPVVIDSSTPSCGDSRFGCWVCTLVEKDKSMQAMVRNDGEKKWMTPLMQIRSEIDFRAMSVSGDRHLRDFRRMKGHVQLFNGRVIPGPYKQSFREHLLHKVLDAQQSVRNMGPEYVKSLQLIQLSEMEEIRRIWTVEKHEIEDSLPRIYAEATGEQYPGRQINDGVSFGREEMHLLREMCDGDDLRYEMVRELLSAEIRHKATIRRSGIFQSLERAIRRSFYADEQDALTRVQERDNALADAAQEMELNEIHASSAISAEQ